MVELGGEILGWSVTRWELANSGKGSENRTIQL